MVSGHLYCDICGAEYQIVPDFEPEIEDSIAKNMFTITEKLDEKTIEDDFNSEIEQNHLKVPAFSTVFFLVIVIFIFLYIKIYVTLI